MHVALLTPFLLLAPTAFAAAAQLPPAGKPPAPAAPAVEAPPPPKPLDLEATERIVRAYESAESWTLRAMVLLSLGDDFAPAGAKVVLAALRDKDERLQPYALELIRRMQPEAAARIANVELIDELVDRTSKEKHPLVRERSLEALARLAPGVEAKDREAWRKWWSVHQKTFAPPAWVAPPAPEAADAHKTTAHLFVERAFDLRDAGLDVAIVIDTTGSMQQAIDTARDAVASVVAMLANLAPKLRLGLVEYKDLGDLGDGASLLVPLTRGPEAVHQRLGNLTAGGGGDMPERVEKGVEAALSDKMGWNKEANRLILVIGDAPPHAESQAGLLELVKRAHDAPFVKKAGAPRTGGRPDSREERLRPFITSLIYTAPAAQKAFDEIAKAGGGASVSLDVGKPGEAPVEGTSPAVRKIVEHIMLLSFGQEHRPQLEHFVRTFFEYLDAKK